jgi:hypothetical protein
MMTNEDINNLIELAKEEAKKTPTYEEALRSFVQAGILDEQANLTPMYKYLEVPPRKE